jgi:PAS domain S-box-containing protein
VNPELELHSGERQKGGRASFFRRLFQIIASAACYYLATRTAWALCFPDSKVSLFFPPHAVLVCFLLRVPTRQWWAYILAAAGSHFIGTQQEHWPPLYALHCEVFDAVKYVSLAAGIRFLVKAQFHHITLRDALVFALIAVIIVPFGTAFWGAAFTVSNGFGTHYWVEWRNLGISNAVTAVVLIPAILLAVHHFSTKWKRVAPARILEASLLGASLLTAGVFAFNRLVAGPGTSPALLYAPIPLLIWAALRFGLGGVSASMLLITVQAIWGTMQGRGPFLAQTPAENALALQIFLLMAATPLMLRAVAIADEKRSNEALRLSEERMSLAAESAHLALWEWDISSNEIWVTQEGRKFFGGAPGERLDYATLGGLVHPDDRAARAAAIERVLGRGESYEVEYRVILQDGSVRWIAARGHSPHVRNGEPVRIRGISMDITRQKQADLEAQQQREALAHLSRVAALGMLSGSLAHELGQPLQAILSNAEAAGFCLQSKSPDLDELRAIVQDIRKDDQRASSVIQRLSALFKRGEFSPGPVALNELLDEVVTLARADCEKRQIALTLDLPSDLPPVHADRVHLHQVLLNLLINGMAALESKTEGQRAIALAARRSHGRFVEIAVSDNGPGITAEQVGRMFDPFFTTKATGMGLGLSISRTLIEAHGGRIWAENNTGGGASFRFTLKIEE